MRKVAIVFVILLIIFANSCGVNEIEKESTDEVEIVEEIVEEPKVDEKTEETVVEIVDEEPEVIEEEPVIIEDELEVIEEVDEPEEYYEETEEYYEEEVYNEPVEEEYIEDIEVFEEEGIYEEPIEEEVVEEVYEEPSMTYYGNCQITAYEWTGYPCANGNYPTTGYTVACNNLPLGTQIYIDGVGYRTVEDRGATWHATNWIDLYLGDVSACFEWGVQYLDVWIVE